MKIYFNQTPNEDINGFGTEGLLETKNGNFYYHCVEFGTNPGGLDEFTIHDGCNRLMPINVDAVDELIEVLQKISAMSETIKLGEDTQELAMSDSQVKVEE